MLNGIISAVTEKLTEKGASPVYGAFDAVPADRKNSGIYTIVGVRSFESTTPIYSLTKIYLPFRAELSGLESFLKGISLKFDSNISRLVLTAVISASGTTKIERSSLQ